MQMLVGSNDGGRHLGTGQQLAVVLGDEVDAHPAGDLAGPVGVLLGKPDPAHARVTCGNLAAEQADPAAADDCQTYLLRVPASHAFSPPDCDIVHTFPHAIMVVRAENAWLRRWAFSRSRAGGKSGRLGLS